MYKYHNAMLQMVCSILKDFHQLVIALLATYYMHMGVVTSLSAFTEVLLQ